MKKFFDSDESYQQYLALEKEEKEKGSNESLGMFELIRMVFGFGKQDSSDSSK